MRWPTSAVAAAAGLLLVTPASAGELTPEQQPGTSACFTDPEGDTQHTASGESPADPQATPPEDEPRADIRRHCVNFGPSLSLTVAVEAPTDPETDPNWRGATFVGWFLDTDGGDDSDFYVDFSLDRDGNLEALVSDIRGTAAQQTCVATGEHTGVYVAADIRPACIGDATSVRVSVATYYDTAPGGGSGGAMFTDTAPDNGAFTAEPVTKQGRSTDRYAGRERMETSVRISQARFPSGQVATVYLARQDLFADAVAGGVLTDGPILLVPRCGAVPEFIRSEVTRLSPARVLTLGGTVAICDQVLADAAQGRPTGRVAGATRIETSVQISRRQFARAGEVTFAFLARADLFADAVAGGVLTSGPILLVDPCTADVNDQVEAEVDRLHPQQVIALGGTAAICDQVLNEAAESRPIGRLAGPGRVQTALEISRFQFPATAAQVHITRADLFADAVVGGVLTGGPILLVPQCIAPPDEPFPADVRAEISRVAPDRVVALGGPAAVCDAVLQAAASS
ncbi:MAG TPA: cell wall-binding repeat-containing protein [Nitriliruptorales bacterium]|nr:cell wall-binding repeat-containing protein [Nitriliruptorales bacterium]